MRWSDHEKIQLFIKKIEDGEEILTKREMLEIILILMTDYWERGLD